MFSLNDSMSYWLYTEPTDMRKSFHTLSGVVRDRMGRNPLDGDVYIYLHQSHPQPHETASLGTRRTGALLQDARRMHVASSLML